MIHVMENFLANIVEVTTIILEFMGVFILMVSAVKNMIGYFRKDEHIRLKLAQGIALALEFKLGSEVLRTVVVREWNELTILGAIIVLRALLTFIIHWEIKMEKKQNNENTERLS